MTGQGIQGLAERKDELFELFRSICIRRGTWTAETETALHYDLDRMTSLAELDAFEQQIRTFEYGGVAPMTERSCRTCRFFSPGTADGRWHPGDPDDCNKPNNPAANLPTFPFANGCKHFEPKTGTTKPGHTARSGFTTIPNTGR